MMTSLGYIKKLLANIGILFGWILFCSGMIVAQDIGSVDFQVIQLAADQVFMQWGNQLDNQEFPIISDTLYLYRGTEFVGALKLIAVNPPRVVGNFLNEPFSITRGEVFRVKWDVTNNQISNDSTLVNSDTSLVSGPTSILEKNLDRQTRTPKPKEIIVSGRIMSSVNLTQSSTQWSSVLSKSDNRWSSTPSTNLNLRVKNLPNDWDFQMQGRYSYRLQTDSRLNKTDLLSLYNLQFNKKWNNRPFEVQIGRFSNRYETNYSYWDGVLFKYNAQHWETGVTAGFEPIRSSAGFQTNYPKLGTFLNYSLRKEHFRWSSKASFTSIFPTDYNSQYNAGVEQRISFKRVNLDGEVNANRDPVSQNWRITRAQIRVNYEITKWFDISGNYQKRTPFVYINNPGIFFDSRYRYGFDTALKLGSFRFNNGVAILNRSFSNSVSYNSRIQWYKSPVWDLSWNLSGSYWKSDNGSTWNAGLFANRGFNNTNISTGVSAYQTKLYDSDQLSGSLYINGTRSISKSLSLSARIQSSISQLMLRNSISVSIWKSF